MTKEACEARRAYYREYYKKNREKIRERQRLYWERKGAQTRKDRRQNDGHDR